MVTLVSSFRVSYKRHYKMRLKLRRLLLHLILLAGGLIWVYPFLWTLGSSLKSPGGFFDEGLNVVPKEFLWSNYVNAWNEASFGQFLFNTLFTTVLTTVSILLFSSMAGFVLARKQFPGKKAVIGIILITIFLPRGYTIIPVYDIIQRLNLLDTLWSIILVQTAGGLIFPTALFMGYFSSMDRDLEDAARVDGAGFNQLFWRVMLPLAAPMLATVALFAFIGSWNDFFVPLVFTLGRPELHTLTVGMFAFIAQNSTNWTYLCAGSVIALAPIMLVFVFLQRYFISAIAGAVKA